MVQCHPCKEAALVWGPPDQGAALFQCILLVRRLHWSGALLLVQGILLVRRMHWIRLRASILHKHDYGTEHGR